MTNVADYIFECASKQICNPDDIAKEALRELQEIDQKLLEADKLRPRRGLLEKVCLHYGEPIPKTVKKKPAPLVQQDQPIDSLDADTKDLCRRICEQVEKGPATPRELMVSCKVSVKDDQAIYASIKILAERGIVSKSNEGTRAIIRGPKWDSRPKDLHPKV
jgi:hypothetical protein